MFLVLCLVKPRRAACAVRSAASCSGHDEAEGSACAENDTEAIAKAVARGDDPEELSDTDGDATEEQVSIGSPNHRTNHPKQVGLSTTVSRSRRKRALWTAQDEERLITVSCCQLVLRLLYSLETRVGFFETAFRFRRAGVSTSCCTHSVLTSCYWVLFVFQFVADDGVEEDAWENKAERLREQRDGCSFSAADVRARWISIVSSVLCELHHPPPRRLKYHCRFCTNTPRFMT